MTINAQSVHVRDIYSYDLGDTTFTPVTDDADAGPRLEIAKVDDMGAVALRYPDHPEIPCFRVPVALLRQAAEKADTLA
ncbi:hypothetical protein ACQEVF_56610 [Nonomuraea polychroma]|uniref:hypothetical protein n=1 Tax=Nonomuraea polychroma TaxID=46176 RepID=UPI003D8C7AD4